MRMPDIHTAARSHFRCARGPCGSSSTNTNRICAKGYWYYVPEITVRLETDDRLVSEKVVLSR